MNLPTKTNRLKSLVIFFTVLISILVIDACRKIDHRQDQKPEIDYSEQFFRVPADTDPTVKRLAAMMKIANQQNNFANKIGKEVGLPLWNKTIGVSQPGTGRGNGGGIDADTLVLVPIGNPPNAPLGTPDKVTGFFACMVHEDKINIRLLRADQYQAYGRTNRVDTLSSETVAITSMILEAHAYPGHDTFDINDQDLFYNTSVVDTVTKQIIIDTFFTSSTLRSTLFVPYTHEACWLYIAPTGPREARNSTSGGVQEVCYSTQTWDWVEGGGGAGSLVINTPPDGGVNSSGNLNAAVDCSQFPGGTCGATYIGWTHHDPAIPEGYKPNRFDTIGITDALKLGYPCIYAFIKDSIPNANLIAQLAAGAVFKDSARMHLYFDTSTIYTQAGQRSGNTETDSVRIDSDGITYYRARITLNGWYLRHGTKEYNISTIIHEVMHAVFTLRWGQYKQWLIYHDNPIDSTWMKLRYPYFWEHYVINGIPPGTDIDHEIMATDYLQAFSDLLKNYYNSAAPTAVRDSVIKALCFGGLDKTTAWSRLPSKGIDTCRYRAIQVTAERCLSGTINTGGVCPNFVVHFADSLKMRPSCN